MKVNIEDVEYGELCCYGKVFVFYVDYVLVYVVFCQFINKCQQF